MDTDEQSQNELDDLLRRHREVSDTLRRTMLAILTFALFCWLTLGSPDRSLIVGDETIKVPFVEVALSFPAFLVVAPFLLIVLSFYLHVFFEEWLGLEAALGSGAPGRQAALFNFDHPAAQRLTAFIFYFLVPLTLGAITWKALARIEWGLPMMMVFVTVTATLACVQHLRSPNRVWSRRTVKWVYGGLALATISSVIFTVGEVRHLQRPFSLYRVDLQNAWLLGVSLRHADVRFANLQGAALRGAELQGTRLLEANLKGADLYRADLSDADLREADLQSAVLQEANLRGVSLAGANLQDADLILANLQGASLRGADLQSAFLLFANLQDADLQHANLQDADLQHVDLPGAVLADANLQGAVLAGADLRGAVLRDANLRGAVLRDANLQGAVLAGADLRGAVFRDANLQGAVLAGADLRGAVLVGADLRGADLRKAHLWQAALDREAKLYRLSDWRYLDLAPPSAEDLDQWIETATTEITDEDVRATVTGMLEEWRRRLGEDWAPNFPPGLSSRSDVLFDTVPPPKFTEFDPKLADFLIGIACAGNASPSVAEAIGSRVGDEWEDGRLYPALVAKALLDTGRCPPAKGLSERMIARLK